jgi:hypothetical protein
MRRLFDPARPLGLRPEIAAWLLWIASFSVLVGLWLAGQVHSISYGVYADAGQRWLHGEPLYDTSNIEGFQYLPQSAILVAPLSSLGSPAGDILWRALGWALLAVGTLRFAGLLAPLLRHQVFLVATCLSIGTAIGPLGNGQANLLLAALTLHVGADVAEQRWWRAAAVAVLGFALKPLMAVLLLLVWALYRPMWWRVPLALAVAAVAPWFFADSGYVLAQYSDCLAKLALSSRPGPDYEDLRGLLGTIGLVVPHDVSTATRIVAAVGTLVICRAAQRRARGPYGVALIVALAAVYLVLFNPRTQSTTYAVPGSIVAVLAGLYAVERRRPALLAMVVVQIAFTLNYAYLPFIELWLKPLTAVFLGAFLVREGTRSSPSTP